jgi:hypothetical protein
MRNSESRHHLGAGGSDGSGGRERQRTAFALAGALNRPRERSKATAPSTIKHANTPTTTVRRGMDEV